MTDEKTKRVVYENEIDLKEFSAPMLKRKLKEMKNEE